MKITFGTKDNILYKASKYSSALFYEPTKQQYKN